MCEIARRSARFNRIGSSEQKPNLCDRNATYQHPEGTIEKTSYQ